MRQKRVLVVQSLSDATTTFRNSLAKQVPDPLRYVIEDFAVLEEPAGHYVPSGAVDEAVLLKRLVNRVNDFHPDILLVHTGYAFRRYPREIMSALVRLSAEFPMLRIGLEESDPHRLGLDTSILLPVVDNSDEMERLCRRVLDPEF